MLFRINKIDYEHYECYNLTDIMDHPILATVNINIGLGWDNPSLVIREGDHVPTLVNKLIENYQLPKKVYAIIMERVAQQLPPPPKTNPKDILLKTTKFEKEGSLSPFKTNKPYTPKSTQNRAALHNKQNNRNVTNIALNESKTISKKSLSPLIKTSTAPTVKKIEIKPHRSPAKNAFNSTKQPSKQLKPTDSNTKIHKLFKYLTKCNPSSIHILSHQHINLKGMDRELLSVLQSFFECLEEHEFDLMTEPYFISRVEELGFKKKLSKKEYEYCYID